MKEKNSTVKKDSPEWGNEDKNFIYPDTYNGEEIPFEFETETISPGVVKLDISDEGMKGYNMAKRMLQGKALEESPKLSIKENEVRTEGKNGRLFVGIDKELLYNKTLTIYDKIILLFIQDHIYFKTGYSSLSLAELSYLSGLGRNTVLSAIKHLESLDIISVYKIPHQASKIFIRDKYNMKRNVKKEDISSQKTIQKNKKTTP